MNLEAWLGNISGDIEVSKINLPGSHDSASISAIPSWYQCQRSSITEQLARGVRLLDVRIKFKHTSSGGVPGVAIMTCHGDILGGEDRSANEFQNFESLMDECKNFLVKNPLEFIAIILKVDDWSGFANATMDALNALAAVISKYPVYTGGVTLAALKIPLLSAVRGKIYLFNRINDDLRLGVPISWSDNATGVYDNFSTSRPSNARATRGFDVYVQDKYEGFGNSFTVDTESVKLALFSQVFKRPIDELCVNFGSFVNAAKWPMDINEEVIDYIGTLQPRPTKLGWCLSNFVTTNHSTNRYDMSISDLIVSSNFSYDEYKLGFVVVHDGLE